MSKCRIGHMKQVFSKPVTVNTYSDDVAVWTQWGRLQMPKAKARIFVRKLLDDGVTVKAFWRELTNRERTSLDARIEEGKDI
jgi:hypothetical protein